MYIHVLTKYLMQCNVMLNVFLLICAIYKLYCVFYKFIGLGIGLGLRLEVGLGLVLCSLDL